MSARVWNRIHRRQHGRRGQRASPRYACNDGTGHCTLRAAIQASNAHTLNDGIFFDIPTAGNNCDASGNCTINLGAALPDLSDGVTISGPGADKLTVLRDSSAGFRIFNVTTTGAVSFSGLTIALGFVIDNGGGIQNVNAGTVNVTNCTLTGNRTFGGSSTGGGISNNSTGTVNVTNCLISFNQSFGGGGGGIYNGPGTVNVTSSTFSGNSAVTLGGGIFNDTGTVTISNSTFSGNSVLGVSSVSGGSGLGGGIFNGHTVTVTNSTFSGNHATGSNSANSGGAGEGGAIYSGGSTSTVNVTNCTLSGNSATGGSGSSGGFAVGGAIHLQSGTLYVTNCTISGNSATGGTGSPSGQALGGGIQFNATVVTVKSTIIANNTAATSGPDVSGSFTSQGFNLIGKNDDGSTGFTESTDQTGTIALPLDPKLDPAGLLNNGGPTQTIALLFGSPAIDKGSNTVLTALSSAINNSTPAINVFDASNIPTGVGYTILIDSEQMVVTDHLALTTLSGNITSAQTTVGVADSSNIPAGVTILIDAERMVVTSKSGNTLTVTRAANGTTAAPHVAGAIVKAGNSLTVTRAANSTTAASHSTAASLYPAFDQRGTGFPRIFNDPNVPNASGGDGTDIGAFEVQTTPTPTATPTATPTPTPGSLGNVSTRLQVGTGDNVLFAGFIIQGSASKTVLIRSAGPSLTSFGVPGALGNPQLELHDPNSTLGTNDNWQTTQLGE